MSASAGWPETRAVTCSFCRTVIHQTRYGDGSPDGRGRPSYWYVSDALHSCVKRDQVAAELRLTRAAVNAGLARARRKRGAR